MSMFTHTIFCIDLYLKKGIDQTYSPFNVTSKLLPCIPVINRNW